MAETRGKRGFSVELKSNEYVKNLNLSREGRESVLVEEVLGELDELGMLEGAGLQVRGGCGTLRVDLT